MQEWTRQDWEKHLDGADIAAFYLYTPFCGTCQIASKMMEVIEELLPEIPLGKANLNYVQDLAMDLEIESVPCLLIAVNGTIREKIYAFHSVPYIYEKMRKMD